MKKIIALILCLVMVFTLCACSAQGLPQNGAGLLQMLKQALQKIDIGIIVRIPAAEGPAAQVGD
jgi:hypothetical protein